jgi:hypothetical protein
MSASDDGGVREAQQPPRSPGFVEGGFIKRGFVGAAVGGVCGAVCSLVTFVIVVFVGARFNPDFGWALVAIGGVPFVGAGVGAIFGAAFLAAKPSFELAGIGGCLGGILTGAFPLIGLFR